MQVRSGMAGRAITPYTGSIAMGVLASLIAASGCGEGRRVTGVRLTIRYDETPSWLHISGASDSGGFYGPTLLPDPPRPLQQQRETVMLLFGPDMHGSVMSLRVVGLNSRRAAHTYGSVQTEIVADQIQSAVVWLSERPGCPAGGGEAGHPCGDDVNPAVGIGDASVSEAGDAELDASAVAPSCGATACKDGATAMYDAALEEPPLEETPPVGEAPPLEEEPPVEELPPRDGEPPPVQEPPPEEELPPEEEPDPPTTCNGPSCLTPIRCESKVCEIRCHEHSRCAYDCGEAEDCKSRCTNASCLTDCSGADRCEAKCDGQADCEIICGPDTDCSAIKCDGDARCLLRCGGEACELRCEGQRALHECGDGVLACNRECPP